MSRLPHSRTVLFAGFVPAPDGEAAAALARAGFGPPQRASTLEAAAARVATERVDLLVLPLDAPQEALAQVARAAAGRNTSVLGAAPKLEAVWLLRAMRAGVQECLALPFDAGELSSALERLERRVAGSAGVGTAIAVYSAKGGLGTTTTAINLAHAYAHNNPSARVVLADLVVSGGDVAVQLDLKPTYDVGTLAGKIEALDGELLRSILTERAAHAWVLAASERPETTELVDGAATAAIVGQLRAEFDFSVVDCEHHVSDRSLAALDASDRVVLVTQLGLASLRSAQRSMALFERLGYDADRVLVVVNRHQSGDLLTLRDAENALGHAIDMVIPNDFRLCSDALAKGLSVVEHAPASPLARAYMEMAARLGGAPPAAAEASGAARFGQLLRLVGRR